MATVRYSTKAKNFSSVKTLSITNFLGVDYSTSKFNVETYHAVAMRNFIKRDNVLQKRFGVSEIMFDEVNSPVYDLWQFTDENNDNHLIAHIGNELYEVKLNNDNLKCEIVSLWSGVKGQSVSAFPSHHRLYVLTGNLYIVIYLDNGTLKVKGVANSDFAYIPTTTIGIVANNITTSTTVRQTLDDVNLLTYWRKNKLVSGYQIKDEQTIIDTTQTFKLDNEITYADKKDIEDITINIKFFDSECYQFRKNSDNGEIDLELIPVFCKGIKMKDQENYVLDAKCGGIYILMNKASFNVYIKDFMNKNYFYIGDDEPTGEEESEKTEHYIYGYLTLDGIITLFNDYPNAQRESNITVKYPHYVESKSKNVIDKCTFGIIYTSNNMNSLFCSGNEEQPATDWHSEEINVSQLTEEELDNIGTQDLVYFPDTSYCNYGNNNQNPVVAYDTLGTGQLLVLKKYNKTEPTIYFRAGTMVSKLNDTTFGTFYKQEYSRTNGNIGKSGLSQNKICNFNGDTLFVANDNTLQGLDKEEKAYDNQRYANTRSYYIDEYLKTLDLSNSFLFYNDDYLFMFNDNECFVHKYGENTSDTGANYEFYHLSLPFECVSAIEFNKQIICGCKNGELYYLENKDIFVDTFNFKAVKGSLLSKKGTHDIVLSVNGLEFVKRVAYTKGNIVLDENNYILTEKIQAVIDDAKTTLTISDLDTKHKLGSLNKVVYQNVVYEIDATIQPYVYNIINTYEFKNNEEYLADSTLANEVIIVADNIEITSIDYELSKLVVDSEILLTQSLVGRIILTNEVSCYYLTAPYTFGTIQYYKNLQKMALSNDKGINAELSVNYIDNEIALNEMGFCPKSSFGFDLTNITFGHYGLTKSTISARLETFRLNLIRKEFVCFNFYNDSDTNCLLSACQVQYSYGTLIN